tara:strand:+ start:880 stop:1812 length:933 start_codon:yes stop_codon:yes gene_type:complete
MSQENIQTDTPENKPQTEFASLEEAVFGAGAQDSTVSDAFTESPTGNDKAASTEQKVEQPAENNKPIDNDTARYQYWQSQADKMKNELDQVKGAYNQLANQQQVAQAPAAPAQEQQLGIESFPDAPVRPAKPGNFNREEALADPSSDSAKYMDAVDSWRDDMSQYSDMKAQYQASILQDRLDYMEQEKVEEAKRFEHQQRVSQQTNEVKEYVMGHHGLSESDANEFVQTMSDPASINIDNLVSLYRMNSGKAPAKPAQPSSTFTQMQTAQQVPSPMGVMPSGQSANDGRTAEDKIMDTMIGNFNAKNPWK